MKNPYLTVCVALALVGAVLLGSWVLRPQTVEYAVAVPPAAVTPTPTPTAPPVGPVLPAGPAVRSAALTPPVPVAVPQGLSLPGTTIEAPVVEVGVDGDGLVDVPSDGAVVGWYRWSAAPGSPGTTVLVGHVDTASDGAGALYDLAATRAGQRVLLTLGDGSTAEYEVVSLQSLPKADLAAAQVFRRDGDHALVLVTCGGAFDRTTRTYAENVVVTAVPVR